MNWGIIFFAWIAIAGAAFLITGQRMKATGKITVGWFIGQDIKMERCRDVKGFIAFTYPKIMAFGTVALVAAIALIILEIFQITPLVEFVLLILLILAYLKFTHDMKRATADYLK